MAPAARNNVARFWTAAKDVHADFMAGFLERERADRRVVTLRLRSAFASQAASAYVCVLGRTLQITTMVESLDHPAGRLDLTRTFLGDGFEPLPDETAALATPSARLEARLGFEGIAKTYDLVFGRGEPASDVNAAMPGGDSSAWQRLYNDLSEAYPELPRVRSAKAAASVVWQCVRKINVSDIEFSLYGKRDAGYQEYAEHVRRLIGGRHLGWVPSPATLRRIEIAAVPEFLERLH